MINKYENIIESPWQRELILISHDKEINNMELSEEGKNVFNNNKLVVVPIEDWSYFADKFRISGGARPNTASLLVLSPYDDFTYCEISESRDTFALQKMSATLSLCQLLGAKSVMTKTIKIYDKDSSKELNFNLQYNTVEGKLKAKRNELATLKNKLQLNACFGGQFSDIEEASKFLKQEHLDTDLVLSELLRLRENQQKMGNTIENLTQEISLTDSLQKTFDLAAGIQFPVGSVMAEFKSVVEEKLELSVTLEINFS